MRTGAFVRTLGGSLLPLCALHAESAARITEVVPLEKGLDEFLVQVVMES